MRSRFWGGCGNCDRVIRKVVEMAIAFQLSLKVTIGIVFTGKAKMNAKDNIKAEIDSLNEEYLDEL